MNGIKYLAGALPLTFLGPLVLTSSFKNQDHPWFIPVMLLALAIMVLSVFFMFKGIRTIIKSLFD